MSFTCIVRLPDGRDATYYTEGPATGDDPVLKAMQRIHRRIVCEKDPIPRDLAIVTKWWDAHDPVLKTPVQQV
jgi:hypothetical protein